MCICIINTYCGMYRRHIIKTKKPRLKKKSTNVYGNIIYSTIFGETQLLILVQHSFNQIIDK